jgi:hypothetical protein
MKVNRGRVLCSLTGLPFIYGAVNMPRLRSAFENASIERAARKELSLTEEDMYLSWQRIQGPSDQEEISYFVAGVPKNALSSLFRTLQQAGIKPYAIDMKPLALARLCNQPEGIIISLEPGYIDIVFVSGGLVKIMHSFSTESQPADKLALVNEVADGLNKALNSFKRDFPQSTLKADAPLFVAGKYAGDPDIIKLIETSSERKVSLLESPLALPPEMGMDVYGSNVGLLLKRVNAGRAATGYMDTDINLVSAVETKEKSSLLVYAPWAVVVAGLAAIMYFTITLQSDAQKKADDQTNISSRIATQLTIAQKNNKDLITQKTTVAADLDTQTKKLSTLRAEKVQIVNPSLDYASQIGYLTGFMPPGGELNSVSMDGKTIVVKGKVMSPFDALNYAVTLDKSADFAGAKVNDIAPTEDGNAVFTVLVNQKSQ